MRWIDLRPGDLVISVDVRYASSGRMVLANVSKRHFPKDHPDHVHFYITLLELWGCAQSKKVMTFQVSSTDPTTEFDILKEYVVIKATEHECKPAP